MRIDITYIICLTLMLLDRLRYRNTACFHIVQNGNVDSLLVIIYLKLSFSNPMFFSLLTNRYQNVDSWIWNYHFQIQFASLSFDKNVSNCSKDSIIASYDAIFGCRWGKPVKHALPLSKYLCPNHGNLKLNKEEYLDKISKAKLFS